MTRILIEEANILCLHNGEELYMVDIKNKKLNKQSIVVPYFNYLYYDLFTDDEKEQKINLFIHELDQTLNNYVIIPEPKDKNILNRENIKVIKFNTLHEYCNMNKDITGKDIERYIKNALSSETLTNWLYKQKEKSKFIESKINELENYKKILNEHIEGEYKCLYTNMEVLRVIIYSKYLNIRQSSFNTWYGELNINTLNTEGSLCKSILAKENLSFEECIYSFKKTIREIYTTINNLKVNN